MTSVESTDTVSTDAKRRNRPGKNARQQAKGGNTPATSSVANPSQHSRAAQFVSSPSFVPLPTPGKYPVIFPSGAGEPTRDVKFALSGSSLGEIAENLPINFASNSKYLDFAHDAVIEHPDFAKKLGIGFYLGLAQQCVHAHVNMGLPQGDFASIFSSDVAIFSSIRSVVSHLGEFPLEALGTRYLLAGYQETVASVVRAALAMSDGKTAAAAGAQMWLPTKLNDPNTRFIIAHGLAKLIRAEGGDVDVSLLAEQVLSGSIDLWDKIKGLLGSPPAPGEADPRNRFDFMFRFYRNELAFYTAFSPRNRQSTLALLGLEWDSASFSDLKWNLVPKATFATLAAAHALDRPTYAKFFSHATATANRTEIRGSPVQLSLTNFTLGVTIVKVAVAVTPGELSLLACFPLSGKFPFMRYNVTVTTSVNTPQKAMEFMQLDWL